MGSAALSTAGIGRSTQKVWTNVRRLPFAAGGRSKGVSFVFQAEDGIRDLTVTGVQTCALPISLPQAPQVFEKLAGCLVTIFTLLCQGLGQNPIKFLRRVGRH